MTIRRLLAVLLLACLALACGNYAQRTCKQQCNARYGPGREREACRIDCYWSHRSP